MPSRRLLRPLAALVLLLGALPGQAAPARQPWDRVVGDAQGMPVLGNPAAPLRVVEFVSYSCPHCMSFHLEADGQLQPEFVRTGKASLEVRPFFRNGYDVMATLLALCGSRQRFFDNHNAILRGQNQWLRGPEGAEQNRWSSGSFGSQMKAMASDLGLYRMMVKRGYKPAELDRCLADKPLADRLGKQTQDAMTKFAVPGTPAFLINGELHNENTWPGLRALLLRLGRQFI